MTWLISHALMKAYENSRSLQGPEVESLAATCLDGEPSAQSNGSPTQQAYLSPDKTTAFSRLSRFGMTFKPLTGSLGEDVSMWCQEVSSARTSVLPEREPGLTEPDQDSGDKWLGWLAKFDRDSCSWRTAQCSLLGEDHELLETLPPSGMTAHGLLLELPTLVHRFNATGYGLLPAPVATDYKGSRTAEGLAKAGRNERNSLCDFLRAKLGWRMPVPEGSEVLMGWPPGWTDLKPLAMDKFLQWQQQHGKSCRSEPCQSTS